MKLKTIFGVIFLLQLICFSCLDGDTGFVTESDNEKLTDLNLETLIVSTNLPARNNAEMIEFNGQYWFMGGKTPKLGDSTFFNDIWNSTDGVSWTQATNNASWSKRGSFNLFVFQNKLWLIGGLDNIQTLNDIWNTIDGITWERVTEHGPWQSRSSMAIKVHNDKLYLVGGHTTTNWVLYQDIWESNDGINWTEVGEISDDLLGTTNSNQGIQKHHIIKLENEYFIICGQLASSFEPLTSVIKSEDMVNWELVTRDTPWKDYANSNVSDLRPFIYKDRIMIVVNSIINSEFKSILYSSINGFEWKKEYEFPSFISDIKYAFLGFLNKPRSLEINNQIYLYGSYESSVIYNVPDTQTHLIKIIYQ